MHSKYHKMMYNPQKPKLKSRSVNQHLSHCSDATKDNTGAKLFLSISKGDFYNQITYINYYLIAATCNSFWSRS